jgi:hypothetical protein
MELLDDHLKSARMAVGDHAQGRREVNLDEFETGVYLCRWPNGDFSLMAAITRREALVELDEWDAAHPSQWFPLESCMVDFKLNDQGEIALKQFGEDTEESIWDIAYPKFHAHLLRIIQLLARPDPAPPLVFLLTIMALYLCACVERSECLAVAGAL